METGSKMADQIAADESCHISTARRAVMIEAFSLAGKDMEYAAASLHLRLGTVKKYAKRFGIEFPPAAA